MPSGNGRNALFDVFVAEHHLQSKVAQDDDEGDNATGDEQKSEQSRKAVDSLWHLTSLLLPNGGSLSNHFMEPNRPVTGTFPAGAP